LADVIVHRHAMLEDILVAAARPDLMARQLENLEKAAIGDLKPVLGIIEAQPLRHIFERGIEQKVAVAQAYLLLLRRADIRKPDNKALIARWTAAKAQPPPAAEPRLRGGVKSR